MRAGVIVVGVALCVACETPNREGTPAKLAGVRVVDLIPLSLSGETWQDAEPVYVGLNDFDAPDGRTATGDVSLDGGATYSSRRIETRTTLGQNGPSIRPAVAQDHTVYVAYFGWRSNAGSEVTSDVVVVRDDSGATGATPFRDLVDPTDHLPGRLVATHVTIPWSNAPTLGQERIGSTLSIAVDVLHSDN